MHRALSRLLPGLGASAVLGVVAADLGWIRAADAAPLALGATGIAFAARKRAIAIGLCAAIVVGALAAGGHARHLALADRHAPRETVDLAVDGTVRAVRRGETWLALELHEVRSVRFGAVPLVPAPNRLELRENANTPEGAWLSGLTEGDRIRARLRLRPIGGLRNPGAPDRGPSARRRGIGAGARLLDARLATVLHASSGGGLRRGVAERLRRVEPGGPLLAALGLGDRSGLAPDAREAFRRLGIGHLLAVSGLHVGLVAALAFAVARRVVVRIPSLAEVTDSRLWACGGAAAAAAGYALLAGWGVPVQRATVFVLVFLLAVGLRRGPAPAHALAAALLWIGIFEPRAIFELGAQLSFAAAAALVADRWHEDLGWRRGLRVSATAIAATAPILALHGVESTPMGLVANIVGVPWTGFVLLPVSLLAVGLAALGASPPVDGLLEALARVAGASLGGAVAAAALVPPLPGSATGWFGVAVALSLGAGALCARRTRARVLLAALASGCPGLLPPPVIHPPPPRIVALDVGLGDAILVQGRDAAILVDGGWAVAGGPDLGRTAVAPALRALGVSALDVVVATHADLDHRGGIPSVLEALPVGEVWVPGGRLEEFESLSSSARKLGVPIREQDARAERQQIGDLRVEVLWPRADGSARVRNESSLVLRIEVEGTRLLLTGDIGEAAERALLASGVDLRADVLKLPHHGSRRSGTRAFLEAVGAEVGLLSAPCSSRGHLPTAEAFERARLVGMSVWWTGRDGAAWVGLGKAPFKRAAWGWRTDPHCRPPAARPGPRRT